MSSAQDLKPGTGLSPEDEPVFVVVGKFRKPHGIRGEIRMTVLTDFPDLFSPGRTLFVGPTHQPYTIRELRWHGGDLLIALEELPDRTAVEVFRNVDVFLRAGDFPELPEGEYYLHQLVGMEVLTDQGAFLGQVKEVLVTGANDVYLIESPEGSEVLLPAIDEVVQDIDLEKGVIRVHLLEGLLD